jgi:glycosyltransferase involved in cell wall biosynthesis
VTVPQVSVVLPARDAAATVDAALRSVLLQTLSNIEVCAIDDRSRDDTRDRLARWAARDWRVRVLDGLGAGLEHALNFGLQEARAPVVARMDADDVCHPERFARQLALLRADPSLGVVGCGVRIVRAGGVAQGFRLYEQWLNGLVTPADHAREIFVESPLAHPTAMFFREEARALGGYRTCPWPEDYDLWLRYHLAGRGIAKVPEALLDWTDHDGRLSRVDRRYARDRFLDAKAHYLARGLLATARQAVVWGAGPVGRRLARALRREGVAVVAFIDVDRRKIGVKSPGGVPVLDPEGVRAHPGLPVLAAVGKRGARDEIRGRLEAMGYREGADYWCCA